MASARSDSPIRWRSRPLLAAAGMVAVGIVLATAFGQSIAFWSVAVTISLLLAAALILSPQRRLVSLRKLGITAFIGASLIALGALRMAVWEGQAVAPLTSLATEVDQFEDPFPVTVYGRVLGDVSSTVRRLSFHLEVDSLGFDNLIPTRGRAAVTIWPPFEWSGAGGDVIEVEWPLIERGQHVKLEAMLGRLPRKQNPADFDYGSYLHRRGLHATLTTSDPAALQLVAVSTNPWDVAVNGSRRHIRSALTSHIADEDARAILKALLLADRSGIDPTIRSSFARTGLAHLLAVSGLHVFLVGMVLYGVLKPVLHRFGWPWRRVELCRAGLTMLLLGAYVTVVGGPTSAVRALVMAGAFIGGRAFERPSNALNSLGAAALALLLARPAALLEVGFQLSFAAVAALILWMPHLERLAPPLIRRNWLADYMARLIFASIAATFGTAPVLMAHFGVFPFAGIGLNVLAIPATGAALGAGLLTVAFHGWLTSLASVAGNAADAFALLVLWTGRQGEKWLGWTAVDLYISDLLILGGLAALILTVGMINRPRVRWRMVIVALACFTGAAWTPLLTGDAKPHLEILYFDVGQGDAALVSLPNGRTMLVDAGPRNPFGDASTRTLIPHLRRFGVRKLDAVVVSHPHSDHLGGVPSLLEAVPIGTLYDNGNAFDSDLYRETVITAADRGVPIRPLRAGDVIELDSDVLIKVLHPGPEPDAHANDASVVLRITYGEVSVLFAGDVETAAEATLTGRYSDGLCADLVKVPHHGSRTSSTAHFVEAVTACGHTRHAVVQVARRNRYNLPNSDVVERWWEAGAEVHLTGSAGAAWFRSDGTRLWRRDWR